MRHDAKSFLQTGPGLEGCTVKGHFIYRLLIFIKVSLGLTVDSVKLPLGVKRIA